MTVDELSELMNRLKAEGQGEKEVEAFDVTAHEWLPVTGATYSGGKPVRLWTDEA